MTPYMTPISYPELAGTQRKYREGNCQRYDDFQGNDGHFIGDWLNIVYFSNTSPESFPALRTNLVCMLGLFNCSSLFYSI